MTGEFDRNRLNQRPINARCAPTFNAFATCLHTIRGKTPVLSNPHAAGKMMAPPKVVALPSSSVRASAYPPKHAASLPSTHHRRQLHLHNSISDRSAADAGRLAQAKHSIKTQAAAAIAPPSAESTSDHASWLERLPLRQQLSPPVNASRLVDTDTVFVEQHRIRGYEVGPNRQATILTIANLLQVHALIVPICVWDHLTNIRNAGAIMLCASGDAPTRASHHAPRWWRTSRSLRLRVCRSRWTTTRHGAVVAPRNGVGTQP